MFAKHFFRNAVLSASVVAAVSLQIDDGAHAASITFDFENISATGGFNQSVSHPGALTNLSTSKSGLTLDISRPGGTFDIFDNTTFSNPPSGFGDRSIDPFSQERNDTSFIINFSRPVLSAAIDVGDFGRDSPDIIQIKAYSEQDATGTLRDIDRKSIVTTDTVNNPFKSTTVSVNSNKLINSIEIIGGTSNFPNSVYYDNIKINAPSNQEASVIGSFTNLIEGRLNNRTTYLQGILDIGDCIETTGCDIDALTNANQTELIKNIKNANEAAFESRTLVTQTSILPRNDLELVVKAKGLIEEIIDGFKLIGKIFFGEESDVRNVEVSGEVGSFAINPSFDLLTAMILFEISEGTFPSVLIGEEMLTVSSILGNVHGFGVGRIDTINPLGNGFDSVKISLIQLESSDFVAPVPLPAALPLFGTALAGMGFIGWCRRRKTAAAAV